MSQIDPCPRCGSSNFELEEGVLYCENGHDQQTGPVTAADEQDFTRQGKVVRKKKQKTKQKTSKILRGRKAYQLYLQAWQHMVWKQCYNLVHMKGLSPELWTVVRDLWALRLSKLAAKVEENPTDEAFVGFSAISSSEIETSDSEADIPKVRFKTTGNATDSPHLIETIALNYLGLLLLRCPVSLDSVFGWIHEEDVPYIRAIRHVPLEIKERLPGEYQRVLDTTSILKPEQLQSAVFRLATIYENIFAMKVPALNFRPILLQYIESLALPLNVYPVVKHLHTITKFDFTFAVTSNARRSPVAFPEAQLISLVVVATKLLYPFDSSVVRTYPETINNLGALQIDWQAWLQARNQAVTASDGVPSMGSRKGTQMSIKDTDILQMSEDQLDEYMDWFQRTWTVPERSEEGINQEILAMFPLKPLPDSPPEAERKRTAQTEQETREARLKEVHHSLQFRRPIPSEDEEEEDDERADANQPRRFNIPRPGSRYQQFRTAACLSGVAKVFHQDAAKAACLNLDTLMRAVNHTEQIIILWKRAKRRAELWGDEMDLEAEMGGGRTSSRLGVDRSMFDIGTGKKNISGKSRSGDELEEAMSYLDV